MSGVLWLPWRDEYNCERPHSSLDYRTNGLNQPLMLNNAIR
jgi:transposase InsO family protein